MTRFSTTCLVSSYNYARFVGEAVDSALRQTVPFDEIIVVDDGSADGSLDLLQRRYGDCPKVRVIAKPNEGQLSCFNVGAAAASSDIVFFLDADDVYEPQYVERALAVYGRYPSCDFLFCARRLFGQQDRVDCRWAQDRDFGYTLLRTAYLREWIGAATSCVSIHRATLSKVLPLPFLDEWRVRADDCLVFGASLAGARKRFLAEPLVRYRVHGNNQFRGRRPDAAAVYRRRMAINRLFEHLERKLCYNLPKLAEHFHREFCTLERPTLSDLITYMRVGSAARVSYVRRLAGQIEMLRHWARTSLKSADADCATPEQHQSSADIRAA